MDQLQVDTPAPLWLRDRCARFITASVVLALLYLGRDVLIPLAIAIMLSLLVTPFVRALRRVGVGHTPSVLIAVLALTVSGLAAAVVLGTQVLGIAESLPHYEETIQRKLSAVNAATEGRLILLTSEASRLLEARETTDAVTHLAALTEHSVVFSHPNTATSEPREPEARPLQLIGKLLRSVWASIHSVGIVLLVLIFVLFEHESLRDRFIRLVGATGLAHNLLPFCHGKRFAREPPGGGVRPECHRHRCGTGHAGSATPGQGASLLQSLAAKAKPPTESKG